jgi:hypothetical protein
MWKAGNQETGREDGYAPMLDIILHHLRERHLGFISLPGSRFRTKKSDSFIPIQ